MNAPAGLLAADPYDVAAGLVNAWRGRCLASFARAEHAVTEALITLSATDASIPLPLLVGQRYEALMAAVGKDE